MLGERMDRHDVPVWLVNTGWTRRPVRHGGERMNITQTRQMVRAALNGRSTDVPTRTDPIFGFEVPTSLSRRADRGPLAARHVGRQGRLRRARRASWPSMFVENFKQFEDAVSARDQRRRADLRLTAIPHLRTPVAQGCMAPA